MQTLVRGKKLHHDLLSGIFGGNRNTLDFLQRPAYPSHFTYNVFPYLKEKSIHSRTVLILHMAFSLLVEGILQEEERKQTSSKKN